ncbi:hypothetical protein JW898_00195 [Candidatus Woesearchaeota archaeon]|nr:hypothetical protein [Candidatus Woesearchaeota archaeon]
MSLNKNAVILITVIAVLFIAALVGAYTTTSGLPDDGVFHDLDAIPQGEGSGLDADTLDGVDSSGFMRVSEENGPSIPFLVATGVIYAEESETKIERIGESIIITNKFDHDYSEQYAFFYPGSLPGPAPDGKKTRIIFKVTNHGNHFCFKEAVHGWSGGGGPVGCNRYECDKESGCNIVNPDENYKNNIWISIKKSGAYTYQKCKLLGTAVQVEEPWARQDIGLVCYVELTDGDSVSGVNGLKIDTLDHSGDFGNWNIDIYFQYV